MGNAQIDDDKQKRIREKYALEPRIRDRQWGDVGATKPAIEASTRITRGRTK